MNMEELKRHIKKNLGFHECGPPDILGARECRRCGEFLVTAWDICPDADVEIAVVPKREKVENERGIEL